MVVASSSVSVVVPTYNEGPRLLDALRSILRQTAPPGEVLVADDGSADDVDGMVATAAAEHPGVPVRLVHGPGNTGSGAARARGIAAATGEWIAVCDADDVWLPTKLERQLSFLDAWEGRRRLAALGTWGRNVNDRLEPVSDAPMGPASEDESDAIVARGGLHFALHSSMLFRRADHDAVGGYLDEYLGSEDLFLWARLARLGPIVCVPEPLVLYRKRPGSVQVSIFRTQQEQLERLALNERRAGVGEPPLDAAAFARHLAAQPLPARVRRRLRWAGTHAYRVGAMEAVNGHRLRGGARLAGAMLLDPGRVWAGVEAAWHSRRR